MDISKLRAFLCVAKHRNFTKASEEQFRGGTPAIQPGSRPCVVCGDVSPF